ncbi:MAG: serine/threonine protein kinase [Myxococcales bacterium]|nr:serine/threonine protein kinase [Myxococcales bacterium]
MLSHGGMGTVLDATQVGINRPVVVKILRESRTEDRARIRRFYQEARLISALDHPNIVRIYEFGVDGTYRVPFIAMERVEGVTLQRVIATEGPLHERRAASMFLQVTNALIEANLKGVLHRDLKPRNVMVRRLPDKSEHLTVLDFGLAKFLEDDLAQPPLTAPGRTVGTPSYMSPEQVLGRPLDFRSDLYGLGCMLFTTLTGRPPFEGGNALAVMRRQVRDPAPNLPDRLSNGEPPSGLLRSLAAALLAKNPIDRPSSLEEVQESLERMARAAAWIDNAPTHVGGRGARLPPAQDTVATEIDSEGVDTVRMKMHAPAPSPADVELPPEAVESRTEDSSARIVDRSSWTWVALMLTLVVMGSLAWWMS